jgi:hypothetical protein
MLSEIDQKVAVKRRNRILREVQAEEDRIQQVEDVSCVTFYDFHHISSTSRLFKTKINRRESRNFSANELWLQKALSLMNIRVKNANG